MEKVYSALYLAIFLQFLRRLHRKMSPQEGELKYGLYFNLADLQMSIRLATAGSPARLEAMRKELWNSASLEITNTSPKYPAFELHSKEVAEILPIILIGKLDAIVTGRAAGNKNVTRL